MPDKPQTASVNHLRFLDSARGIAALMVFAGHFIDRGYHDNPSAKYLLLIFNGNDAVSFFFVLSGFVLSYKYLVLKQPLDLKKFWVSRIFRLIPAYFITIVLNVLLVYRNDLSLSKLSDIFIFNKNGFWEEALMIRFHNVYYFPGWSLTFEMVCSFLIPFYITLAMRDKRLISYFYVVLLIIGNSLAFSAHFLLGILISCYFVVFSDQSFRLTKWYRYRYLVIPITMVLFSVRRIDRIFPLWDSYKKLAEFVSLDFFLYSGLASFVFIVAIIQSKKAQRFLEQKLLVFIGKISYSIYLLHTFSISIIYLYLLPLVTIQNHVLLILVAFSAYAVLTILLASMLHRFVELPFMAVGKRITGKMKSSLVVKMD